ANTGDKGRTRPSRPPRLELRRAPRRRHPTSSDTTTAMACTWRGASSARGHGGAAATPRPMEVRRLEVRRPPGGRQAAGSEAAAALLLLLALAAHADDDGGGESRPRRCRQRRWGSG